MGDSGKDEIEIVIVSEPSDCCSALKHKDDEQRRARAKERERERGEQLLRGPIEIRLMRKFKIS